MKPFPLLSPATALGSRRPKMMRRSLVSFRIHLRFTNINLLWAGLTGSNGSSCSDFFSSSLLCLFCNFWSMSLTFLYSYNYNFYFWCICWLIHFFSITLLSQSRFLSKTFLLSMQIFLNTTLLFDHAPFLMQYFLQIVEPNRRTMRRKLRLPLPLQVSHWGWGVLEKKPDEIKVAGE